MLEQILSTMYIDPELLARLNEDDRQCLFHKMRVEQVRRWEAWQEKLDEEEKARKKPKLPPKPGKKRVHFKLGNDGEPWTHVIDDVKWDSDDEKMTDLDGVNQTSESLNGLTVSSPSIRRKEVPNNELQNDNEEAEDRQVRAALTRAKRLAQKWEDLSRREGSGGLQHIKHQNFNKVPPKQDWIEEPTAEEVPTTTLPEVNQVYALLRNTQRNAADLQNSIRRSTECEEALKENENTDPETVNQIREIARKARREVEGITSKSQTVTAHENQRNLFGSGSRSHTLPVMRTKNRPGKLPSRAAIMEWFRTEERPRNACCDKETKQLAPWFHGLIDRQQAENLLMNEPVGTFLVRFCVRIWGYAISHRTEEKCKHYLIDASNNGYQALVEGSMKFSSLSELIEYYKSHPITPSGQDQLLKPCSNANSAAVYNELFA